MAVAPIRRVVGNNEETGWVDPEFRLSGVVGNAPVRRTGDPGSNPGPGMNVSIKLTSLGLLRAEKLHGLDL